MASIKSFCQESNNEHFGSNIKLKHIDITVSPMASFGDSFLDMAEAMLKYNRSSSTEGVTDGIPSESKQACSDDNGDSNIQNGRQRSVLVVAPPKRQKLAGGTAYNRGLDETMTRNVVCLLSRAVSDDERLEALDNAIKVFDHNDIDLHNIEIEAAADVALVKHLVFIKFKSSLGGESMEFGKKDITQEIGSALECLECVYRASSDAVGKSFKRVGNDVLHILVNLIDEELKNRSQANTQPSSSDHHSKEMNAIDNVIGAPLKEENDGSKYVHDLLLRKASKIIGHFARVGKATKPMVRFPGFLDIRPYSLIPFEARLSCLWAIANLACNAENMSIMIDTPGLVDSLITICNRQCDSGETLESIMEILRAKSIVSRTLLNLSWSVENKVLMSKNPALIQALCRLALNRHAPFKKSKTIQNILIQTRRHSLASLRNISAAPKSSKIALCDYYDGNLLDTLTDAILNETDQSIVNFAFSAICNLAIYETAEVIVDRAALVLALKNVLLEDGFDTRRNDTYNKRCQCASSTILVLERAITPDKACYTNFRELMDAINPTNSTKYSDESTKSIAV